jgi:hypothetical protein
MLIPWKLEWWCVWFMMTQLFCKIQFSWPATWIKNHYSCWYCAWQSTSCCNEGQASTFLRINIHQISTNKFELTQTGLIGRAGHSTNNHSLALVKGEEPPPQQQWHLWWSSWILWTGSPHNASNFDHQHLTSTFVDDASLVFFWLWGKAHAPLKWYLNRWRLLDKTGSVCCSSPEQHSWI